MDSFCVVICVEISSCGLCFSYWTFWLSDFRLEFVRAPSTPDAMREAKQTRMQKNPSKATVLSTLHAPSNAWRNKRQNLTWLRLFPHVAVWMGPQERIGEQRECVQRKLSTNEHTKECWSSCACKPCTMCREVVFMQTNVREFMSRSKSCVLVMSPWQLLV